jgi:predicted metal-binding protein
MGNAWKTYDVPWSGELVLACRKCQKKLKGDAELGELAKLKKAFKLWNKAHPESELTVLNVPCMDLCPKGGVTVCVASERPARLRILRSVDEIGQIVAGNRE